MNGDKGVGGMGCHWGWCVCCCFEWGEGSSGIVKRELRVCCEWSECVECAVIVVVDSGRL